jgi:hypothetical protein
VERLGYDPSIPPCKGGSFPISLQPQVADLPVTPLGEGICREFLALSRKDLTHLFCYIDQTGDQLAVQVGVHLTVCVESFPGLIAVISYLLFS